MKKIVLTVISWLCATNASASINDLIVSDVTTRSFSVVWQSSEPVNKANLRVFSDKQGKSELTHLLTVSLPTPVEALQNGIAKLEVNGLSADSTYYFRLESTGQSGEVTVYPPSDEPLAKIHTVLESTRIGDEGELIHNPIVSYQIARPDNALPTKGTLLTVSIPNKSAYPVTAFTGVGNVSDNVIVDLNNLYAEKTSKSLPVNPGDSVQLTEYQGLLCEPVGQPLVRLRKLPNPASSLPMTEISSPVACFSPNGLTADFNCDRQISYGDFNLLLSQFGVNATSSLHCKINSDYDLNTDKSIDYGDFNLFLSVFGVEEASNAP